MSSRIVLSACLCAAWTVLGAGAARTTEIWYPDCAASSPGGRFVLVACRPPVEFGDQDRPFFGPHQPCNYRLFDLVTGRTVWHRNDFRPADPGLALAVGDDGTSAILTMDRRLILLSPGGTWQWEMNIAPTLRASAPDEIASYTLANRLAPWFDVCHLAIVATGPGESVVSFRPWWGSRLILGGSDCRDIADDGPVADAVRAEEAAWVRRATEALAGRWTAGDDGASDHATVAASLKIAFLAGSLPRAEAVEVLRRMEGCGLPRPGRVPPDGGREGGWTYVDFPVRQAARLALRRLGEAAGPLPGTRVLAPDGAVPGAGREAAAGAGGRSLTESLAALAPGQDPGDVVRLAGPPDTIILRDGPQWVYDVDGPDGRSVILRWSGGRVESVRAASPPLWTTVGPVELALAPW